MGKRLSIDGERMKNVINKGIEFEFIHKDLYGVAIDVVKKFVSQELTRPILTYALHTKNGDILATNSHKAIHIKGIHGFKEDYLVNPKSYMFAKGTYPELDKVIDKEKHFLSISLSKEQIKLWLQLFKSINHTLKMMKSKKSDKVITLFFRSNEIEFVVKVDPENTFTAKLPTNKLNIPEFEHISFSSEMMRDALEAHFKLNSEQLNVYFHGQFRPIILDDEELVKTVVLPVRRHGV